MTIKPFIRHTVNNHERTSLAPNEPHATCLHLLHESEKRNKELPQSTSLRIELAQ